MIVITFLWISKANAVTWTAMKKIYTINQALLKIHGPSAAKAQKHFNSCILFITTVKHLWALRPVRKFNSQMYLPQNWRPATKSTDPQVTLRFKLLHFNYMLTLFPFFYGSLWKKINKEIKSKRIQSLLVGLLYYVFFSKLVRKKISKRTSMGREKSSQTIKKKRKKKELEFP